jgi:hypothetical protein
MAMRWLGLLAWPCVQHLQRRAPIVKLMMWSPHFSPDGASIRPLERSRKMKRKRFSEEQIIADASLFYPTMARS